MKTTLNDFASAGIVPEMVQVGNEISSGILHDDGKVGDGNEDFSQLAQLLESAISGVRDSSASNTRIILHLDQGGKNSLYTWFFGELLEKSPDLDFDIFGLSYYPMWHGTMDGLQYNLNYLSSTYNKEVCVVETAYAWTTEDGDGVGNVFISGDENIAGYPATPEGQFAFMNDLESIKVLNQPSENLLSNISFEADGVTAAPSGWNVWLDGTASADAVKTEYGNAYDGDYKLTFWDDEAYSCSIYKTFTNLPNGTYQFTMWAMTNGGQDTLQLYAKGFGGNELTTTIPTSDINWNIYSIDEIVVTNNTLEIGVYTVAGAGDWCNLDMGILRKVE